MYAFLAVMLGGALGSGLRYGVSLITKGPFPYGTLSVNLVGCFAMGMIVTCFDQTQNLNPLIRLGILVGFLGGFTTFSSFGLDTVRLMENDRMGAALTYVLASNLVGIAAVWGGIRVARLVN